jgi:hypothetical protein
MRDSRKGANITDSEPLMQAVSRNAAPNPPELRASGKKKRDGGRRAE